MIYIFVDTNIIEAKAGSRNFLDANNFKQDFRDLIKYIVDNKLQDKVKLCVPEIVCREMLKHLHESYIEQKKELAEISRTLGSVGKIEINPEYQLTLEDLKNKILVEYANIVFVDLDVSKTCFDKVIKKAIDKEKPFKSRGGSSDAGFKDVLIWETMLNLKTKTADLTILFTDNINDFDGAKKPSNNYTIIKTLADVKKEIEAKLKFDAIKEHKESQTIANASEKEVRHLFEDKYWQERAMESVGLCGEYNGCIIEDASELLNEDGEFTGTYTVYLKFTAKDGSKFKICAYYDYFGKEIEDANLLSSGVWE